MTAAVFDSNERILLVGGSDADGKRLLSTLSFANTSAVVAHCYSINGSVVLPRINGLQRWINSSFNQSALLRQYDSPQLQSTDELILDPFQIDEPQASPVLLSSSGSALCVLRSDHTVVCTNVTSSGSRSDSFLWSGSGYSYVHITALDSSSVGIFLLTAEPERRPVHVGRSSLIWNQSSQFTDDYCFSPVWNIFLSSTCSIQLPVSGDRGGVNLAVFVLSSWNETAISECSAACCANDKCVAYVAMLAATASDDCLVNQVCCYLKSSVSPIVARPDTVNGLAYRNTSLLQSLPLRRHIELPALMETAMQSVCGDSDKACALTMKGTVHCWHSHAVDDAPITVSPPAFLRFTQMTCGFAPNSAELSYACGIIANVGMRGRFVCWQVSGNAERMKFIDNIVYWTLTDLIDHLEEYARLLLWQQWYDDPSVTGYAQCAASIAFGLVPVANRVDNRTYYDTPQSSVFRSLSRSLVIKTAMCADWSESCALLSIDDIVYRTDHRFTQLNMVNTSAATRIIHAVSLSNGAFNTTVTARLAVSIDDARAMNPSFIVFDQTDSPSASGSWSQIAFQPRFETQFNDDESGAQWCVDEFAHCRTTCL